ncbi:MAG: hypothetical protein HN431_11210 [Bacteroidetes bacterium]|nr:hypothetical protein [Bacteroidota bacterium]
MIFITLFFKLVLNSYNEYLHYNQSQQDKNVWEILNEDEEYLKLKEIFEKTLDNYNEFEKKNKRYQDYVKDLNKFSRIINDYFTGTKD